MFTIATCMLQSIRCRLDGIWNGVYKQDSHLHSSAGERPEVEVDVLSVESWDRSSAQQSKSRSAKIVRYGAPYSAVPPTFNPVQVGSATTYPNNRSYINIDSKPYYSPGWAFWAMPFGCVDTMDAADLGGGRMQATRKESDGCEGFYISSDGYALNRDYMVPAYNMSDYYQIFPTWSDGANVAGYRRDKVSPVSFLPAARLGHYRNWTYGPPDFAFKAGNTVQRLVIIFHWDFSPKPQMTVGVHSEQRNMCTCCTSPPRCSLDMTRSVGRVCAFKVQHHMFNVPHCAKMRSVYGWLLHSMHHA